MSVIGEEDQAERENDDEDDEEEKAIRRFLINDLLIPRAVQRRVLHRLLLSRMLRRRLPNGQQRQEIRNFRQESTDSRAIPFHPSSRMAKRKVIDDSINNKPVSSKPVNRPINNN